MIRSSILYIYIYIYINFRRCAFYAQSVPHELHFEAMSVSVEPRRAKCQEPRACVQINFMNHVRFNAKKASRAKNSFNAENKFNAEN